MHRIICELRPRIIILENVATIIIRGLPRILGGLSELGYDAEWKIITASQFGAPHQRKRWFLVAYANSCRLYEQPAQSKPMEKDPFSTRRGGKNGRLYPRKYWTQTSIPEPVVRVLDDGISDRVAAFRALGNAIVPQCSEYVGLKLLNSGLLDDLI
jgi:DNA (cytosine-5)-methyltransferase 1